MLDESQWWAPDQLVAWQRQHLQLLLNHARATSPFYRFRLNKLFTPNGRVLWDRWHEVPILKRSDLATQFDALLSRAPIAEHGATHDTQSSGSTGHPVTTRGTQWLLDMSHANNWRAQLWAGLNWSKVLLLTGAENKTRKEGDTIGMWGPPWEPSAQSGRLIYSYYGTSHDDRLRLLRENRADYYATTAFSGGMTAERAIETGAEIHFGAMLARSGAVTESLRELIRTAFGARVLETYSSKEGGAIAHPCPTGQGLHVNAESALVEIVDQQGVPVAPGQAGRVVITPFGSTALPLIRYDQGDIAIAGGQCSCGRCLPLIASISGRERAAFSHPDGRRLLRDLPFDTYRLIGAGLIQVAQVGPISYEVRYTPRPSSQPRDERAFIEAFRGLYFEDAELTFVEMAELPLSANGKFMSNVVEWRPDVREAGPIKVAGS